MSRSNSSRRRHFRPGYQALDDGVFRRSGMVAVVVAVAGGPVVHGIDHHGVIIRLAAGGHRENVPFIVLGQVIRRPVLELELKRQLQ